MASVNPLEEMRKRLPPAEMRLLAARLRVDTLVWSSLGSEIPLTKLLDGENPTLNRWSPAALGLAAIRADLTPESLSRDLSQSPENAILEAALKLFQETRRTGRCPRTLAEATQLALALRQHWNLAHSWKGLYNQLAPAGGEADWGYFRVWRTALACLYGLVPDPLDMLRGLTPKRHSHTAVSWSLHVLTSNPLTDLELEQAVFNLAAPLPPLQQVAWLRSLKMLGHNVLVESLARQILARIPASVMTSLTSTDTIGQDLEALFLKLIEMQRMVGLYRYANQPANAQAMIRRIQHSMDYWQSGLTIQEVDLGIEKQDVAILTRLSFEKLGQYPDLQQELALLSSSRQTDRSWVDLLPDPSSPFVQIQKSLRLARLGRKSDAQAVGRTASESILSQIKESRLGIAPNFAFDWQPVELINALFEIGLRDEAQELVDAFLGMRQEDRDLLFLKVQLAEEKGNLEKALDAAQMLAALDNTQPEWHRRLGRLYGKNEAWESAFSEFQVVLDLENPPTVSDWVQFAHSAYRTERWGEVEQASATALKLDPENGVACALMGKVRLHQNLLDEAGQLLLKSTLLAPDEPFGWLALAEYHLSAGRKEKSLETLRAAVLAIPESAEINYTLARNCLDLGYLADGLPYLRRAVELAPQSTDASLQLGKTLHSLGRLDEAENVLRLAHFRWPQNTDLAYEYGRVAMAGGDLESAHAALAVAIRAEPVEPERLLMFAETCLGQSPYSSPAPTYDLFSLSEAVKVLEKVIELDPQCFSAHLLLAEVMVAQQRYEEASPIFDKLWESPEAYSSSYRWRLQAGVGRTSLGLGQVEKALAALQEAVQEQNENAGLKRLLAEAFREGDLPEDGIRFARLALKLAPDDINTLRWYAGFMVSVNEPAEALYALNCATQLDPRCIENWLLLAHLQQQSGDVEGALASLDHLPDLPGVTAANLLEAARIYMAAGKSERALQDLVNFANQNAAVGNDFLALAACFCYKAEKWEQGFDLAQRASNEASEDPYLYILQADFLAAMQRPEAALASLEHARRLLQSETAPVWPAWVSNELLRTLDSDWLAAFIDAAALPVRMACLYRKVGNSSAALQCAQQAFDIHPRCVSIKILSADLAMANLLPGQAAEYLEGETDNQDVYSILFPDLGGMEGLTAIRIELDLDLETPTGQPQLPETSAARTHPRLLAVESRQLAGKGKRLEAVEKFQAALYSPTTGGPSAYQPFVPQTWLLKAALDTWHWEDARHLCTSLLSHYPNEAAVHFWHIRLMVQAALTHSLMSELQIEAHLPAFETPLDGMNEEFEKAIQELNRLSVSKEINLWKAAGRATFKPGSQNLRNLAGLMPSPTAAKYLTSALRRSENLAGAVQVADQYPDDVDVGMQDALTLLRLGSPRGLTLAREISTTRPWDPLAQALHAILASHANEPEEALAHLEEALAIWPREGKWHISSGELAGLLSDSAKSIAHWERAYEVYSGRTDVALALGSAQLRGGESEKAVDVMQKVCSREPERPDAWFLLARAYLASGRLDDAIQAAGSSVALEPSSVKAMILCGQIHLQRKELEQSLSFAQKAWNLAPGDEEVIRFYSDVLVSSGRVDQALSILEQSGEVEVSLPVALARCRLLRTARSPLEALEALKKLAEKHPGEAYVLALLAQVQAETGDEAGAERTANKALQLESNQAELYLLIGKIQKKAGNLDKAVQSVSSAVRARPDQVEGYLELAGLHIDRREPQLALDLYRKAIVVAPDDHRAYYQAAQVQRDMKDYQGAEAMLRKATGLAPDDVNIKRQLGAVITLNLIHNSQEATTSHEQPRAH